MCSDTIDNPIIRGFNPDPSITKKGETYYIAVSTFEYFPGITIYRSQDLKNFEIHANALTRRSQIDLLGQLDSDGVWAPCLRYYGDRFYLIYSNVRLWKGTGDREAAFHDVTNYLITSIDGVEWSDPVELNGYGIDPSLFIDDNGKAYLLTSRADYRGCDDPSGGILIQELNPSDYSVGAPRLIFEGSDLGHTEGPNLYKIGDTYFLVAAEGGTSFGHCVVVLAADHIMGPYKKQEPSPFFKTSSKNPIQKAGHASLVHIKDNLYGFTYLGARVVRGAHKRFCTLGRETCLGYCTYEDGRLIPTKLEPEYKDQEKGVRSLNFTAEWEKRILKPDFLSLRVPYKSFSFQDGGILLTGQESISSRFNQAILVTRVREPQCTIRVDLDFHPDTINMDAGLVLRYSEENLYYLRCYYSPERKEAVLDLLSITNGIVSSEGAFEVGNYKGLIPLQIILHKDRVYFQYGGYNLPGYKPSQPLSDEGQFILGFTGSMAGVFVSDRTGQGRQALFKNFEVSYDNAL